MDFAPDERALEVQRAAREFARDVLAPAASGLDRVGGFPREALTEAARRGLLGINVARELGGRQAGTVAYSLAVTELARACAATTVALCVNNMVAEVIAHFGTAEQKAEHVPKLCDGTYCVGAFALSEPGAGSDPASMLTRARPTDRGWVIAGSKLWITSGTDAGLFIVWARTNDAPGTRGISAFIVRGDTPGITRGRPEHKLGLNGSTTTSIEFNDCEVPADALLDGEGRGFRIAMMALDGGRIGIASQALGVGWAALDYVRSQLHERSTGAGLTLEQDDAWPVADSAVELEAAQLLTLQAAWRKQQGQLFSREASIAKVFATERAFAACNRLLPLLGIEGLTDRTPLERHLRDVRVTMIYEGTSEVQRIVIGREVMRRFAQAG